jgi:iron(III) transport system permease protein
LWTSAAATLITLAIATSIAVSAARFGRIRRLVVLGVMTVPLLVPPFVSALSWTAAYGVGGLLDDLVGFHLPGLVGPFGVVALLVVSAVPLAYLIVAASLEARQERDLVRAARVSGASAREALRTITLPVLRPALIAAGAVTFIMSSNAFGVPAVLGTPARFTTATTRIYRDLVFSSEPAAFNRVLILSAFLVVATIAIVAVADSVVGSRLRLRVEPSGPGAVVADSGRAQPWIGGYVVVTTVLPLVALVLMSVTRSVGLGPLPPTFENYRSAFATGAGSAFVTSAGLAVAAATAVVVLGGLLVALERRSRAGASTVAALAFAVPGSVLAVTILLAYGPWVRDTVGIILIAYIAKFWALGHRPIAGAADGFSPDLFGAARVSGASATTAVRTIVIPMLRPALVGAWLIVFMFGLHELTMSSLLRGPGVETLAVAVLDLQQLGDQTVTAALAVTLTLAAVACALPMLWLWRRHSTGRSA